MKTTITAVLAAATVAGVSFHALAAEMQGEVATVDPQARTVMLSDGSTWTAADTIDLSGLEVGDQVTIVYEDGTTMATEIVEAR